MKLKDFITMLSDYDGDMELEFVDFEGSLIYLDSVMESEDMKDVVVYFNH